MKITPDLFQAYLKCPTKCWLRATGESPSGNTYAEWVKTQNDSFRVSGTDRLAADLANSEAVESQAAENLKEAECRLATGLIASAQMNSCALESELHAVERVPAEGRGKAAQFIPIRFIFTNKLGKDDKLLLGFDSVVLSESLKREVGVGKIVHGDDHSTLKVKTSALRGEVHKRIKKIAALLSSPTPPDLILNRHCTECEFQARCRQKATEKDDLSLLSAMTEKERSRHRSMGIFTVNQLSYTFRPRRTSKRAKNPAKPHYLALQALAIRENTVYVHGNPQFPDSKSQVYLDIEGLPDSEFYYLIGALVVSAGQETFHAYWADQKSDEQVILTKFIETVCELPDFRILHYGGYETVALRRMRARLPEHLHPKIDILLERATNVLSVVHPLLYFPTYSNGLKDIGRFLGCERTHESATGLLTIAWRKSWETSEAPDLKASLLQYNRDDCRTLKEVYKFIRRLTWPEPAFPAGDQLLPKTTRTDDLIGERPRWQLFREKEYALEDFKHVNKCAYFDYQREKVFVRTHRQFRTINRQRRMLKRTTTHPNRITDIECKRCPACRKRSFEKIKQMGRQFIDLKFSKSGVKRWIMRIQSYRYKCQTCGNVFRSEAKSQGGQCRYGHALMSWCVYSWVFCGMNMNRTRMALGDTFEIFVDDSRIRRFRHSMTSEYQGLYGTILQSILHEKVLHIDETSVKLRGTKGYVWVLAGIDKVYYLYKPSREGSFLEEMLHSFSGVLISDFYAAYDSLPCEQQKCLVHFVRDIDEDLLRNPLDTELKGMAQEFGAMLRTIIQTVDRYGLKCGHLRKHKPAVLQFLDSVVSREFSSELADKYKRRFQKSGAKMFTFLDHDGVPWNNNNAEHAIKSFANFRRHADGRFTERSMKEYLVLASVVGTCEFNNVNVLKFLLSTETTLDGLMRMAGRKTSRSCPPETKSEKRS